MQIKDLKATIQSNIHAKEELHARIDLLEAIVKKAGLFDYYCKGCFEYHKGNKEKYLSESPVNR